MQQKGLRSSRLWQLETLRQIEPFFFLTQNLLGTILTRTLLVVTTVAWCKSFFRALRSLLFVYLQSLVAEAYYKAYESTF